MSYAHDENFLMVMCFLAFLRPFEEKSLKQQAGMRAAVECSRSMLLHEVYFPHVHVIRVTVFGFKVGVLRWHRARALNL